ncbi:MAG TPA: 1,6-anhydro-N-acetylmuramyl-L-alanine amidase AmpD [Porticoccus sp.]|nr:1,6-anhydro-N-acetylmuramyl-L-alanine amidase AmpD [Porticoccus sp.]
MTIKHFTIDQQGWLVQARRVPSPNFNSRPAQTDVSLLVIHNISLPPGQFGGPHICDFFTNSLDTSCHPYFEEITGLKVSAHLLIDREGHLTQFVSFDDRAWHAGESCYEGRDNCNGYSIGIELEGADDIPYSDHQYEVLAAVTRSLSQQYPTITKQRIVGHSDIAPGRKTDPGPTFDWQRYFLLMGV